MKVLAVCVGKPKEHQIFGKTVRTSIVKNKVEEGALIHEKGIQGDKPAVHPDAVYAFSHQHYNYWAKELGLEKEAWDFGYFGENLTLEDLDESKLCIGDILEIGESVLQIVSCRVPCFKLAWRLKQDQYFLRTFSLSGKTGIYFKVLKTGFVKPGDTVTIKKNKSPSITVKELSIFLCNLGQRTEEEIQTLLKNEHLGIASKAILLKKLVLIKELKLCQQRRWNGWKSLVIDKIEQESENTKSFYLKDLNSSSLAGYRAGQFLTCRLNLNEKEKLVRTWTISDYSPSLDFYRITVKKLLSGKGSSFLHEKIKVGDLIEAKAPNGNFFLDQSTDRPIVFISAGIGITPMISMVKAHINRDLQPAPKAYFIYITQNSKTHSFKKEIHELKNVSKNIKCIIYYSQPLKEDLLGKDFDKEGRFKLLDLEDIMKGNQIFWGNQWLDYPKEDSLFYLCGPLTFQNTLKEELIKWGATPSKILTEKFVADKTGPSGVKAEKARVFFSKSNVSAIWNDQEDLTLLELAEKAGLNPPSSCRMGTCETCKCPLNKGSLYYDQSSLASQQDKTCLPCCAKPGSSEVEIEL